MGRIDRIILAIKRGETPAARAVREVYRQITGFELPDTAGTRPFYTGLYRLHDAWQDGRELLLGKLLWEPMVRARFHHVGQGVRITGLPYIRGHAKITIGDDCRLGAFSVMSGRYVDEPELVIGKGCT